MEKKNPWIEANQKIRRTWGNVRPVTKFVPNKKKNPKPKHKNTQYEETE